MVKKTNNPNICNWPLCKVEGTMEYEYEGTLYILCGNHWEQFCEFDNKDEAMKQLIVKRKKKVVKKVPKKVVNKKVAKKAKKVAKKKKVTKKKTTTKKRPLTAEQKRIRRIKRKQGVRLVWFGSDLLTILDKIAKQEHTTVGDLVRDAVRENTLPLMKDKIH